jgi:hypothetical protein
MSSQVEHPSTDALRATIDPYHIHRHAPAAEHHSRFETGINSAPVPWVPQLGEPQASGGPIICAGLRTPHDTMVVTLLKPSPSTRRSSRILDPFDSSMSPPLSSTLAPAAWRTPGDRSDRSELLPEVGLAVRRCLHSVLPDEMEAVWHASIAGPQRRSPPESDMLRKYARRMRNPPPTNPRPITSIHDLYGRYGPEPRAVASEGDVGHGLFAEASAEWSEETVGLLSVKSMSVMPRLNVSRSETLVGDGHAELVALPTTLPHKRTPPLLRTWVRRICMLG